LEAIELAKVQVLPVLLVIEVVRLKTQQLLIYLSLQDLVRSRPAL